MSAVSISTLSTMPEKTSVRTEPRISHCTGTPWILPRPVALGAARQWLSASHPVRMDAYELMGLCYFPTL